MSTTHHPSDATLMAYANGSLAEAPALVVMVHLAGCPECRKSVRAVEMAGGALLAEVAPAPMSADALSSTMARLNGMDAVTPPAAVRVSDPRLSEPWVPEPLRHYRLGQWRWLGPGIRQIVVVPRGNGCSARLVRLAPGKALPRHGHGDLELACVLHGSFSDESGQFTPGDVLEVDAWVRHRPVAGTELACICLIATCGQLRVFGPVGRLIQSALRI